MAVPLYTKKAGHLVKKIVPFDNLQPETLRTLA